jgi:hypothetical protein
LLAFLINTPRGEDLEEGQKNLFQRNVVTQIGLKLALCISRELVAKISWKIFPGEPMKNIIFGNSRMF